MTSNHAMTGRWVEGWVISCILHSVVIGLALLVVAEIKDTSEKKVFRWEIALVQPEALPSPAAEAQPAAPSPTVSPSAHPRPMPSSTPAPQRIETKKVVETIAPNPTPVIAQPVERQAIERTPAEHVKPVTQPDVIRNVETDKPQPLHTETQPLIKEPHPAEESATAVMTQTQDAPSVQTREPLHSAAAQERDPVSQDIMATEPAVRSLQPIAKTDVPVEEAPVQREESVLPASPPVVSSPSPIVRNVTPMVKESQAVKSVQPTDSGAPVAHTQRPPESDAVQEHSQQALPERAPLTTAFARQLPAARADFGWLTQALWRRIEQLKRYPHTARMNRWEGTVVVRAVIQEDGYFADLIMEKSSGHEVLDQDAIELLRRASPLTLKHELGRPELTIRIPISYKLE